MSEFVPTTEHVRDLALRLMSAAEFDAWLAKVKADAWDEGYNACNEYQNGYVAVPRRNPYRAGGER